MLNRFNQRVKSDKGNAVLIMGLAIFGLILFLSVFIVDLAKNRYMQTNYTQMAQRAAQTGLKEQNSIGGLTPDAAKTVIYEYLEERNPNKKCTNANGMPGESICQTSETQAFRSLCGGNYKDYPKITVSFSKVRNKNNNKPNETDPIAVADISVDKNGNTNVNNINISPNDEKKLRRGDYKVITIKAKDFGDNYFYSMFGRQCNVFTTQATAIAIDADAGDTGDKDKK